MPKDSDRYLRNPDLRAALYESTEGRCAVCEKPLETGWHADHIVPWAVSKITNVFGMQALCPDCNSKKGDRMSDGLVSINRENLRPGQRDAIDVLLARVREGKQNIAIVLPPGYGKSDVIRVSSVILMLQKQVSRALILEPAEALRHQIVNRKMMQVAADRYNLPPVLGSRIQTYEATTAPTPPFPPSRHANAAFVSMTIQMANANIQRLIQWVRWEQRQNGAPPIIFVDEAHTGSDRNEWGNTTRALREAGAIIVLMTGTPYRADGRRIEGFDWEVVETRPVTLSRPRRELHGEAVVDIYEGHRSVLKLIPDFEYSLRQSWDVDNPPALCKMTRLAYDFDLNTFDAITGEQTGSATLSQLPPSRLIGRLGEMLREDKVIEFFCNVLRDQLIDRQKDAPDSGAIVFVGNDRPDEDDRDNYHAHRVVDILGRIADFECIIATSAASSEGIKALQRFQDGKGDVLVVKQMGGVGYDVPRLKVELDLSVVRTAASFVQRVARVARVWQRSDNPDDVQMTAVYITPDDILGAALWQNFIADQHGETSLTNVEYVKTVQATGGEPGLPPREHYAVEAVRNSDFYSDTNMQVSPGETLPTVQRVIRAVPPLQRLMTLPDVEKALPALRQALEMPSTSNTSAIGETTEAVEPKPAIVEDGNAAQKADQEEINALARRAATKELGRPYTRGDAAYGETVRRVMFEAKKRNRIPNKRPRDYTLEDVAALKATLLEVLAKYG